MNSIRTKLNVLLACPIVDGYRTLSIAFLSGLPSPPSSPSHLSPSHSCHRPSPNDNMASGNKNITTIVVCGPSGSGKTTLLQMLTKHFKDNFQFCVSHTTRTPREGEKHGESYYFVDVPTFRRMIENKEFVEHAEFSGNLYGTSQAELTKVKNSGRIPILDVDLRGVKSLKAIQFDAKYLFITAPNFEYLERNLRKRGSETESHIETRLKHAKDDMAVARDVEFDLVIVNQIIEQAFQQFCNFVQPDVDRLQLLTKS